MKSRTATRWATLAFILIGLTVRSAVAAPGPQVRFEMARPFRVGNHGFEGGMISVHSIFAYTPSISILEVWVNGECLGMMTAQRSVSAELPILTEATFQRDDDGRLEMTGFRMAGRSSGTTYRFPATRAKIADTPLLSRRGTE